MFTHHMIEGENYTNIDVGQTFYKIRKFHGWKRKDVAMALSFLTQEPYQKEMLNWVEFSGQLSPKRMYALCDIYGTIPSWVEHISVSVEANLPAPKFFSTAVGYRHTYPKLIPSAYYWLTNIPRFRLKFIDADIQHYRNEAWVEIVAQAERNTNILLLKGLSDRWIKKLWEPMSLQRVFETKDLYLLYNGICKTRQPVRSIFFQVKRWLELYFEKSYELKRKKVDHLYRYCNWVPVYPWVHNRYKNKLAPPADPKFRTKSNPPQTYFVDKYLETLFKIYEKQFVVQKVLSYYGLVWDKNRIRRCRNRKLKVQFKEYNLLKRIHEDYHAERILPRTFKPCSTKTQ